MNPTSKIQNTSRLSPSTSRALGTVLRPPPPGFVNVTVNINESASPSPISHLPSPKRARAPRGTAFSLIELLVVVTIIGILAAISVPVVGGALQTAKKAEVTTVAQSVRTAIMAWNSEYGTWPTNVSPFEIDSNFLDLLTTTNQQTTNANPRGIIFLEVPAKFTNAQGLVTPAGYLSQGRRERFSGAIDLTGSGQLRFTAGGSNVTIRSAVAVWAPDNKDESKVVGTWK